MNAKVTVVGIGADGWDGMAASSQRVVRDAEVVLGGQRHLEMLPSLSAMLEPWPSPLIQGLPIVLDKYAGKRIVVIASGDPLVSGIATTLINLLGAENVDVLPGVSSVSLARARMGWSAESCDMVTVVGRDHDVIRRYISPGRRLVVLSSDGTSPTEIATRLVDAGFGPSRLVVLSNLGSSQERRRSTRADAWLGERVPELNVVCVECRPDGHKPKFLPAFTTVPGLPDDAFENDGQITRRDVRVSALARLAPCPGELLWDLGAGAGSIAIEWLRSDPRCTAIAVERDDSRIDMIRHNASKLGVPDLETVHGQVPESLEGLPTPNAIFVGGGATATGAIEQCWEALAPGGRLVVHAVTIETEAVVLEHYRRLGGELTRISVESVGPLGGFHGWAPARAVVQWFLSKPFEVS
ncbi:MAG TPA: precorrin-6y C5,15-methyltransferase (decarboxylating) subunit CbiE [Nocardioidaceae bacterium]|nr:precorrin-6y C5,15-methyltransferase (decarboxylating) subunit CbiE [Nocardioidaceae bacterium]